MRLALDKTSDMFPIKPRLTFLFFFLFWCVSRAFAADASTANGYSPALPPGDTYATINASGCISYTSPSGNYTWLQSGVYQDTINNVAGFDSVMTINLTINMPDVTFIQQTACESYYWALDGNTYINSGNYAFTTTNVFGCDSTVILDLTIVQPSNNITSISACDSFFWPTTNTTYTTGGTYSASFINQYGCDSVETLILDLAQTSYSLEYQTVCDSFVWSANGTNYTSSGTYIATLTNAAGCDSIATLNLTVLASSISYQTASSCDQYFWAVNGQTYFSSGTYNDTLVNSVGCDSIVQLDLVVNNSYAITDVVTSCGPFTWIDGVTYSASTNTPVASYTTVNGCDSVITLNLTVGTSYNIIDSVSACAPYTWINGVDYNQSTTSPSWLYLTSQGCDSLITLHLDILQNSVGVDSVSVCDSFTWINGVTYYSSNYSASCTVPNSQGCDSFAVLNLTILNPAPTVSISNNTIRSDATGVLSYQWLDCDNNMAPVPNADSYAFAPGDDGFYAVKATNQYCSSISNCVSLSQVGLYDEILEEPEIVPNPSNGEFKITGNWESVAIYDVAGRIVLKQERMNTDEVMMTGIAPGKYIASITTKEGQVCIKDVLIE